MSNFITKWNVEFFGEHLENPESLQKLAISSKHGGVEIELDTLPKEVKALRFFTSSIMPINDDESPIVPSNEVMVENCKIVASELSEACKGFSHNFAENGFDHIDNVVAEIEEILNALKIVKSMDAITRTANKAMNSVPKERGANLENE